LVQRCGGGSCACNTPASAPAAAKVRIGRPDDAREDEADRTADLVLRAVRPSGITEEPDDRIHRQATDQDELPVANTQELFPPEELERDAEEEQAVASAVVQRKATAGHGQSTQPNLDARLAQTASGGRPLARDTRDSMESGFGHSFTDVRVHDDAESATLCDDLSARAFTLGRDIYFSSGEFRPGTSSGDRLLAHELTHVVQQRSTPEVVARDCQFVPGHSAPDTYCETEAEAQAGVTHACPPDRADFVYRDGPPDRRWRPIPGYGCAHYVAHRLGITTGQSWENCRSGNSVTIEQIVRGRTANALASAQVDDIWVLGMVHSGVVTSVETDAAGQLTRARVNQCNTRGGVANIGVTSGDFYR
jgi:hypothetical protein